MSDPHANPNLTMAGRAPPAGGLMLHALAKNWWLILLRGICAILFGVMTFAWPGITLVTLILVYGIYALADGVLAVWAAFSGGTMAPRWWLLVVGLIGILAGLVALLMPGITALVLLLCIAGWAIASGVIQIFGAIRLRKEIDNEWWLVAAGALSVLFPVAAGNRAVSDRAFEAPREAGKPGQRCLPLAVFGLHNRLAPGQEALAPSASTRQTIASNTANSACSIDAMA